MADRPVLIRNLLMRGMKPGFALAVVTAGECKTIVIKVTIMWTKFWNRFLVSTERQKYNHFCLGIHYYLESKNDHGHH